jgi:MFS family permease
MHTFATAATAAVTIVTINTATRIHSQHSLSVCFCVYTLQITTTTTITNKQFSMVIGILASNLLSFPLAVESSWRYLFGVTAVLALCQLLASPFIVESPRWLLSRDEYSVKVRVCVPGLLN